MVLIACVRGTWKDLHEDVEVNPNFLSQPRLHCRSNNSLPNYFPTRAVQSKDSLSGIGGAWDKISGPAFDSGWATSQATTRHLDSAVDS